jgi:hypothetical protein
MVRKVLNGAQNSLKVFKGAQRRFLSSKWVKKSQKRSKSQAELSLWALMSFVELL